MSVLAAFLTMLLTSVTVNVNLTDGQQTSAELSSVDDEKIGLLIDAKPRLIARSGVRQIDFERSPDVIARKVQVQLVDDSDVSCDTFTMSGGRAKVASADSSWSVNEDALRAVRWLPASDEMEEQWKQILSTPATEDLLVIRRDSSLDYLAGVVLGVTEAAIEFEYSGDKIPVPLSRAAGFILARKREGKAVPRLVITTHDGSEWNVRSAVLRDDKLQIVSMGAVSHELLLTDLRRIEFAQVGAVFLSDLQPASIEFEPFFGSTLRDKISQLSEPRVDRTIQIVDESDKSGRKQFRKGLSVQSRTELVYRLAGKYLRFRATAGMDPSGTTQADVQLTLFVDDREVYSRSISKSDSAVEIDVDVAVGRRLKLLVDYGANIHLGDRLHLGDARLMK